LFLGATDRDSLCNGNRGERVKKMAACHLSFVRERRLD
jgi:hypothetical protein